MALRTWYSVSALGNFGLINVNEYRHVRQASLTPQMSVQFHVGFCGAKENEGSKAQTTNL